MKQETDLQALQLEADEVLRGLSSMQHFLQPASRVQRTESIGRTEATFWVDGQPARPLASYLHPLQAALRLSLVDAAAELLIPVIEGAGAPLLVLHPVIPPERLDAYARLRGAYRGWGITGNHSYACDDGQPANGLRLNLSPVPPTADEAARALADAARGATDALATYWLDCLKAGRVDRLDRPSGLPSGAVLGVLDSDAAMLWPALSPATAGAESNPELPAELTARRPGDVWTHAQQDAALAYVNRRVAVDPTAKKWAIHDELGHVLSCTASNIKTHLAAARKREAARASGVRHAA